ncbi:ABC transporter substrate-binding protein [Desulfoluna spongiiphila]|uniref:ABC transporter, substrate-binding protein, aliphatic sulfonates family n=1 Tax=Desulfoluna spongiiphila TaxID=419481 RepID=A0A1G5CUP4_9BACT|nr:ABC transporter substrate-binding protein [Desulfoluna spongiiphila]SCY06175.1 ABC transporter, substrate-binding protein, aliphatic sulfonates family [Desulfoluna spongiiphila]
MAPTALFTTITPRGRCPRPLFLVLTLGLLVAIAACTEKPKTASEPIRFAFQNRIGSALPVIAVEKGFFADQGLDVKPLRFNNGPACAEALYSGSADFGTMGDTTAIISASRSENLTIIASHCTGEHRHRLIVRDGSPYKTLADLSGKRVGIKKGTSTYGGFLAAMAAAGMPAGSITVTDLSPSTLPEALAAGSIEAFAASEPTPSMGELKGGRELMTFGGLGNRYPIMLLAQNEFLTNREADTLAFMEALKTAEGFVRAHPEETAAIMARATGLPPEVMQSAMERHTYALTMDAPILSSLSETAAFLKAHGKVQKVPDFSTASTDRYLR